MSQSLVPRRLAGSIEMSPRGPLLRAADGMCWRIRYSEQLEELIGNAVIVEGVLSGSVIDAYYLAPRMDPGQC